MPYTYELTKEQVKSLSEVISKLRTLRDQVFADLEALEAEDTDDEDESVEVVEEIHRLLDDAIEALDSI